MTLASLRAQVDAADSALQSHVAASRRHGELWRARLHAAWPWLWLGSGALLGVLAERRVSSPAPSVKQTSPAGQPTATAAPSLLASVPWLLLLDLLDRAMRLADRPNEQGDGGGKGP